MRKTVLTAVTALFCGGALGGVSADHAAFSTKTCYE